MKNLSFVHTIYSHGYSKFVQINYRSIHYIQNISTHIRFKSNHDQSNHSTFCFKNNFTIEYTQKWNFQYNVRLFSDKAKATANVPIFFDSAKYIIPYPTKRNNGDDAAFCTSWHLAVADGVGSWGFSGIDPGQYSRELIHRISSLLQQDNEILDPMPSPVNILKEAYINIQSIGSTTCCLVFLDSINKQIMTANLGDSGFIVYRPSLEKIVCRSQFQCHDFNYPLQLGTGSSDGPADAEQLLFPILVDDWVILGTDGLWDNLYEQQIIDIILKSKNSSIAAQAIAKSAFKFSIDRNWNSPFSSRERKHLRNKSNRFGGKPDDISVVVAQIREAVIKSQI